MTTSRRRFFRLLAAGALAPTLPGFMSRALAQPTPSGRPRTLVCLFQRGAVDGLSMVVPHFDPGYYADRAHIAIGRPSRREGTAIDLDGRFGLHPAMRPLREMWNRRELAVVHAVGSPHETRSHFEAQHYMEAGITGRAPDRQGWLNRVLQQQSPGADDLPAVAIGGGVPMALRGQVPVFGVRALGRMRLPAAGRNTRGAIRQGLERLYEGEGALGDAMTEALGTFDRLQSIGRGRYEPEGGAEYPRQRPGRELMDVARLIKAGVGLRVAFVSCGGWDTHTGQGAAEGGLARNLGWLAESLAAFRRDLGDRFEDVVVLTMSEFGRTVAQNGTGGTDHGHGTAMLVMGGPVRGRRVVTDWPGLAPEQRWQRRDLAVTTDFRDLFGEVAQRHLGVRDLASVFPEHTAAPDRFPGVLRS